jgi:Biotin carboxylase
MKKVLILGGSLYQVYVIKEALRLGYYVITCDYLPDNPGHNYAHEYHNVSTTDKEAVLQLAKQLAVDGVVCYASDPAAPVAAYVCEQLGLPTSPYQSVEILSKKDLFRSFLLENGFNVPQAKGFSSIESAIAEIDQFQLPVMIKPIDSSGSKGVNKLTKKEQLTEFAEEALSFSRDRKFIIEEFIEKQGSQISGDAFSVKGELVFWSFANEFYSSNKIKDFVPLGECWPLSMSQEIENRLLKDIQRLISLLGMNSNAYNIEAIVDKKGDIYILEVGARSGGSLIPQIIQLATGVNMVTYVIKAAMGEDCSDLHYVKPTGFWSNYMLHSKETGVFKGFLFDESFKKNNLVEIVSDIEIGNTVRAFQNAGDALGTIIIKYDSEKEMLDFISNPEKYVQPIIQ